MATPNPLANPPPTAFISQKTFHIAGILTNVYGLEEIPPKSTSISCLWLLHPRLQTKEIMREMASRSIHDWNQRSGPDSTVGLIAIAFDQRNHGSRQVTPLANEAWNRGNETHAQDMFSIINGTVIDISLLIDHIGSYIFNTPGSPVIDQHLVAGISLGGHAAWQALFAEPRITAGVVIIGCPDYMRVMTDRARLSKLQSYTTTSGAAFLGSKDFPLALVESIKKWDPKGIIFGTSDIPETPSESEQQRIKQTLNQKLKNKRILVCSGGSDKLVPYHASESFLKFLKNATSTTGWYKDGNVYVEDILYPGVGHECPEEMHMDTIRFVSDVVAGKSVAEVLSHSKI